MRKPRERRDVILRSNITATTRRRADAYCDEIETTISELTNRALIEFLDAEGVEDPDPQPFKPADPRGRK